MTLTQRHTDVDATSLHRISVNTTSFKGYVPAWIEQVLYYLTLLCRIDVVTTSLRHVLAWIEQVLQYSTLLRRIDVVRRRYNVMCLLGSNKYYSIYLTFPHPTNPQPTAGLTVRARSRRYRLNRKQGSFAHSLSLPSAHRPDTTGILLKRT